MYLISLTNAPDSLREHGQLLGDGNADRGAGVATQLAHTRCQLLADTVARHKAGQLLQEAGGDHTPLDAVARGGAGHGQRDDLECDDVMKLAGTKKK